MPVWQCHTQQSPGKGFAPARSEPEVRTPEALVTTEIGKFVESFTGIDRAVDLPAEITQSLATAEINLVVLTIGGALNHLEGLRGLLAEQLFLLVAVGHQ